jgi:D-alanyl-D-alanine carboxypeptidase
MTNADPSFDLYGGGGVVATAADLAHFWRALLRGRVVGKQALAEMKRVPAATRADGGAGIQAVPVGRYTGWQHAGFWGTNALTVPAIDATITVSIGQADRIDQPLNQIGTAILKAVLRR